MDYSALKLELLDWLEHLEDVEKMELILDIKKSAEGGIVAYTTSGKALTESAYIAEVEKGFEDIKAGRVKSHQDIKNKYSFNG